MIKKIKTLLRTRRLLTRPNSMIFLNLTFKNTPDRQQWARFRELQKNALLLHPIVFSTLYVYIEVQNVPYI